MQVAQVALRSPSWSANACLATFLSQQFEMLHGNTLQRRVAISRGVKFHMQLFIQATLHINFMFRFQFIKHA